MLETPPTGDKERVASSRRRVLVGAFVDRSLKRSLETRARANERTVSAELRLALRHHLKTPAGDR